MKLGELPGVMDTTSGWMGGKEVVAVDFDPKALSFERLLNTAQKLDCASTVFATSSAQLATAKKLVGSRAVNAKGKIRLAKPSDRRYNLRRHSVLSRIPMTKSQAMKVNVAVARGQLENLPLSPRQQRWQSLLQKKSKAALAKFPVFADGVDDAGKFHAFGAALEAKLGQ